VLSRVRASSACELSPGLPWVIEQEEQTSVDPPI
jgi:hypothetical protein